MAGSAEFSAVQTAEYSETPSREAIRRALAPYTPANAWIGLEHFLLDYAVYGAAILGVLFWSRSG